MLVDFSDYFKKLFFNMILPSFSDGPSLSKRTFTGRSGNRVSVKKKLASSLKIKIIEKSFGCKVNISAYFRKTVVTAGCQTNDKKELRKHSDF